MSLRFQKVERLGHRSQSRVKTVPHCDGAFRNVRARSIRTLSGACSARIAGGNRESGGGGRNRTGVHGFAVRCMATLPPRRRGIALTFKAMPMKPWKLLKPKGEARWLPLEIWSGRRVSNSRPQPWQGCALPTELRPHGEPRIIAGDEGVSNQCATRSGHMQAFRCRRSGAATPSAGRSASSRP
jgi:hypothetical protein